MELKEQQKLLEELDEACKLEGELWLGTCVRLGRTLTRRPKS